MPRRGSKQRTSNRFESVTLDVLDAHVAPEDALHAETKTQFVEDASKSVISENKSPDLPFRYSLNPYRGCEHGCSYCYARPTHEYLGYDAGLDFESRIVVKRDAPDLFRKWLARPKYVCESVVMSGVTDPYQPCERRYRITRECLKIAAECGQPMSVISKNALILRDLDVFAELAERKLARAAISLTTLDADLARRMEPRTSTPAARLRAIRELTDAGVPVRVMTAPIIPGLNDIEIPALLEAAADHGAVSAGHVLLRLPLAVEPVFREWLASEESLQAAKVEGLVKQTRGGGFYSPKWGERQSGVGLIAEQINQAFRVFAKRLKLDDAMPPVRCDQFTRPELSGQMRLFA